MFSGGLLFFLLLFFLTATAALYAVTLANLVRAALCLVVVFAGLGTLFIFLRADFVGAVQLFVYVGAIAILILFAVMLTRNVTGGEASPMAGSWLWGGSIAAGLFFVLGYVLFNEAWTREGPPAMPEFDAAVSLRGLSGVLLGQYPAVFQLVALLLTAALVGAIVIAGFAAEKEDGEDRP